MLILPEIIEIQITDELQNPFQIENILIGIQTFANNRNDISLYPFVSNRNGIIKITKGDLKSAEMDFVSYGLMDYYPIENAKPKVQIKFWSGEEINKYLEYWENQIASKEKRLSESQGAYSQEFSEILEREKKVTQVFKNSENRKYELALNHQIIDKWNNQSLEYKYILPIRKRNVG